MFGRPPPRCSIFIRNMRNTALKVQALGAYLRVHSSGVSSTKEIINPLATVREKKALIGPECGLCLFWRDLPCNQILWVNKELARAKIFDFSFLSMYSWNSLVLGIAIYPVLNQKERDGTAGISDCVTKLIQTSEEACILELHIYKTYKEKKYTHTNQKYKIQTLPLSGFMA